MPSSSTMPRPASPKFGTWGSSCIWRPIPWPTSDRITDRPSRSTRSCTAWETSPSRFPGTACAVAASSDSRVAFSRRDAIGLTGRSATVRAASATQPSYSTPTSIDSTSPAVSS